MSSQTSSTKKKSHRLSPTFELKGRTSNVEIKTSANVANTWIYLNYALINQDTGQAWDFGREVSYYYGSDSDGSWTEGKHEGFGHHSQRPGGTLLFAHRTGVDPRSTHESAYSVEVKRDVPVMGIFGIAFLALLIPAIIITWRSISFERARWSESDHPSAGNSDNGGNQTNVSESFISRMDSWF